MDARRSASKVAAGTKYAQTRDTTGSLIPVKPVFYMKRKRERKKKDTLSAREVNANATEFFLQLQLHIKSF